MSEKIEVGNRVNIFFNRVEPELNVKVLDFPAGAGDSWRVQRMDGTIVQVQTYAKMVRLGQPTIEGSLAAGALSAIHAGANIGAVQTPEEEKPGIPEEDLPKKPPAPPESKKREESPFKK